MDLLVGDMSHYVYIKDFKFMYNKTKSKSKKQFFKYCLQCFSSERVVAEYKETCLNINGKQTVKLRSGWIKFKDYFKRLAVPFKIYADFECTVKEVKSTDRGDNDDNASYTEKYQKNIFLAVLLIKLLMINLANQLFFIKNKNVVNRFIKAILEEYEYFKKSDEKTF